MAARSSTSTTMTNNTTTTQSSYNPYPNYNTTPNPHHNNAYYQNYYYNDQQYQPSYNDPQYQPNYNPATTQSPQALTTPPFPLNTKSSFTSSTCSKKSPTLATKVKKFFSALGAPPTRDHDELSRNAGAGVLGSEILGTAYHEATHGKLQDVRGEGGGRDVGRWSR